MVKCTNMCKSSKKIKRKLKFAQKRFKWDKDMDL